MLVHGVRPDSLANADEYFGAHALELDRDNVTTLVLGAGVETILTAGYMTDDPRPFVAAAEKIIVGGLAATPAQGPLARRRDDVVAKIDRRKVKQKARCAAVVNDRGLVSCFVSSH
jgi:hypothetical protein